MATIDIATLDTTPYQTTPLLPTEATVTLGFDLYACKPQNAPAYVEKAAKRMSTTAGETRQIYVERIEAAGISLATEASFDTAVDRFWAAARDRLGYWMNYEHEGLDLLTEAQQDEIDLEGKREQAILARELDQHLFGTDGLAFLRRPFAQQVTLMASRLTFIDASEKVAAFSELLGPDLLATLNVLQARYEGMVLARSTRDDSSSGLRALRVKLQRHIQAYATTVLSMLDEDEPESAQIVVDALRPMLNARIRRSRSTSEGGGSDEEAENAEASEGDELEAGAEGSLGDEDETELEFDDEQTD